MTYIVAAKVYGRGVQRKNASTTKVEVVIFSSLHNFADQLMTDKMVQKFSQSNCRGDPKHNWYACTVDMNQLGDFISAFLNDFNKRKSNKILSTGTKVEMTHWLSPGKKHTFV